MIIKLGQNVNKKIIEVCSSCMPMPTKHFLEFEIAIQQGIIKDYVLQVLNIFKVKL